MKRRTFVNALIALPISIAATSAFANDDGLYQDVFDPQSSFVRVLTDGQPFAAIGDKRLTEFVGGVSGYVNVMPGQLSVTYSDGTIDLTIAPSMHYTVILRSGAEPVVVTDTVQRNPAKADVTMYNLATADGLDLYVPAARAVALPGVMENGGQSVALKAPLTLDFEIRSGEQTLASVTAVELKRRAGVTVVVSVDNGAYSALAVADTYLR